MGIDGSEITDDVTFEELGMDSLDYAYFIKGIEEEFDIIISHQEAKLLPFRIHTFGEAWQYIKGFPEF